MRIKTKKSNNIIHNTHRRDRQHQHNVIHHSIPIKTSKHNKSCTIAKQSDSPRKTDDNKKNSLSPAQLTYVRNIRKKQFMIRLDQLLLFVGFIILWEYTARKGIINDFIFCSPSKLFATFITMLKDGSLMHHIGITLYETLAGFAIVIIGSLIVATLFWWNETLSKVLEP